MRSSKINGKMMQLVVWGILFLGGEWGSRQLAAAPKQEGGKTTVARAADTGLEAEKKQKDDIQGTWKVVAIEANGRKAEDKEIRKMKWTITADKIIWSYGPDFLYQLNPSKKPRQIDLRFPERKSEVSEGIYTLKGDELKVCIGKTTRPTDFTAPAGSRRYLYVLKREKKK